MGERTSTAGILIVDDQETHVRLLERILAGAGFERLAHTTDPREAARLFDEFHPDLVLLDLVMFPVDGFAVMEELLGRIGEDEYLPIVMLTGDVNPEHRHRALALGARDFINKPFDHDEVILRVRNLLETRALFLTLRERDETIAELTTLAL